MLRKLRENEEYQIIALAVDKKSGKKVVVYQEMFGEFPIYTLPEEDFNQIDNNITSTSTQIEEQFNEEVDLELIQFLDADSYKKKIDIFRKMSGRMDERMLNNIAVSLDVTWENGEDAYEVILQNMMMRVRYEEGNNRY